MYKKFQDEVSLVKFHIHGAVSGTSNNFLFLGFVALLDPVHGGGS